MNDYKKIGKKLREKIIVEKRMIVENTSFWNEIFFIDFVVYRYRSKSVFQEERENE